MIFETPGYETIVTNITISARFARERGDIRSLVSHDMLTIACVGPMFARSACDLFGNVPTNLLEPSIDWKQRQTIPRSWSEFEPPHQRFNNIDFDYRYNS